MIEEITKRLTELSVDSARKKSITPLTKDLTFEEELRNRLNNLNLAPLNKEVESSESETESSNEDEINNIETMFKQSEPLEVNRIMYPKPRAIVEMKPYYPRPSPVNLQYEDTSYNYVQYDGSSIVEWNIDGLSDYQIKNVIQFMTMYAISARVEGSNSDQSIAKAIIASFTGQLRGWWDFSLSEEGKAQVLNAVKTETRAEGPTAVSDSVNTLLYTIGMHFIGSASLYMDRSQEQLMNLRCPDLSHFKWYKDNLFSLIFTREDNQYDFWKEKFLSGLPSLFSERVNKQIRDKNDGSLPYNHYTYGELASEVVSAGITLCNELKIHRQLQKERLTGKRILDDFCEQLGLPPVTFLYKGKVKRGRKVGKGKKFYRNRYPKKDKGESSYRKAPKRKTASSSKKKKKETNVVCYKCGKTGHYANKCRVKQQIQALSIDENLKESLIKILLNDTEPEDLKVNVIDYTSEESSTDLIKHQNVMESVIITNHYVP
ncbi:uncharacterized protein LOC110663531 [Hevea brasiliensis]|uniref:uncharacterized protein LOC110663531 n=1 Tax=Hevea brasiliensis TaxID=3981 RepID=UPI0025F9D611|nr:uncharacterized protein LOC110663531 [Hevea brasiliensis]